MRYAAMTVTVMDLFAFCVGMGVGRGLGGLNLNNVTSVYDTMTLRVQCTILNTQYSISMEPSIHSFGDLRMRVGVVRTL